MQLIKDACSKIYYADKFSVVGCIIVRGLTAENCHLLLEWGLYHNALWYSLKLEFGKSWTYIVHSLLGSNFLNSVHNEWYYWQYVHAGKWKNTKLSKQFITKKKKNPCPNGFLLDIKYFSTSIKLIQKIIPHFMMERKEIK